MVEGDITLQVRYGKETLSLPVNAGDTVFDLKCRIFSMTKVPPSSLKLIGAGRSLEVPDEFDSGTTLSSLHLKDGSRIMAMRTEQ